MAALPQLSIVQDNERPAPSRSSVDSRAARVRRRARDAGLYEDQRIRAGKLFVLRRLCHLLWAAFRFALGSVHARLARIARRLLGRPRDREKYMRESARRFKRTLQRMGGTWIKLGQQMSLRTDILPAAYCSELESLLDSGEALRPEYVTRVLEKTIGGELTEVFQMPFDFEAVGKASVACVYRAHLLDGSLVAVKVRRPDIRRIFDADLTALEWFLQASEYLTLIRPGISRPFRAELRRMLEDELDFRAERHYQELFRRYLRRRKKLNVTAPRLYSDLCGKEVIVSEFVTGLWMKDLLRIVEKDDQEKLRELAQQGIHPKKVAKRLIRANHYQFFECPFFHGDPHQGNILIQPGGRIVMIDFGACGVFGVRERAYLRQMHEAQAREDIAGMVSRVIHLMEPLPPADVDGFRHELEHEWWLGYYGIKSKHSSWQERTSFRLWRELLRLVQKYSIPLPLNVLRMIRATLLYDTIGARLYPRLDVFKEYRKHYMHEAKRVRRKINRAILRQLACGPDLSSYVMLERFLETSRAVFEKVENLANKPDWNFGSLISKGFATFHLFIKWFLSSATLTMVGLVIGAWLWSTSKMSNVHQRWWDKTLEVGWPLNPELAPFLQSFEAEHLTVVIGWLVLVTLITLKYIRQISFSITADEN